MRPIAVGIVVAVQKMGGGISGTSSRIFGLACSHLKCVIILMSIPVSHYDFTTGTPQNRNIQLRVSLNNSFTFKLSPSEKRFEETAR